jgi:hypothetical protein
MPIGIPGCPLLAFSTASIAKARIALAMSLWLIAIAAPSWDVVRAVAVSIAFS